MTSPVGLLQVVAQAQLDTLLVRPRRSIGPLVMQVVVDEHHHDDLEITDHPVEQGALITDHAFKRPAEVTIRGHWSESPSVSGLVDGALSGLRQTTAGPVGVPALSMADVYKSLLDLQSNAIPFDVYTGKRKYKNMLVRSLSVNTDRNSENSLEVTAHLREVILVSVRLVSVPSDMTRQAVPTKTAAPTTGDVKQLVPAGAGAGRGFVNPPLVTP